MRERENLVAGVNANRTGLAGIKESEHLSRDDREQRNADDTVQHHYHLSQPAELYLQRRGIRAGTNSREQRDHRSR